MLGNGYKERLASAQTSIGSLLLSLSKTSSQQQQLNQENDSGLDDISFVKHSAFGTPFLSKSGSAHSPLPPAPALESNSASRHSSQKQPSSQPNRSSRLPNASSGLSRFSFDKVLGAEEFIPALHGDTPLLSVLGSSSLSFQSSRSPSRWDRYDGNHTPMSNSPKMEEFPPVLESHFFKDELTRPAASASQTALSVKTEGGILDVEKESDAVRVLQRAVRRFLLRKHARMSEVGAIFSDIFILSYPISMVTTPDPLWYPNIDQPTVRHPSTRHSRCRCEKRCACYYVATACTVNPPFHVHSSMLVQPGMRASFPIITYQPFISILCCENPSMCLAA